MALVAAVAAAGGVAAWRTGFLTATSQVLVRPVPPGHREIAWIAPATSGDSWERLVAALKQLQIDWSKFHPAQQLDLALDKAFLDLTADVPEISLGLSGPKGPRLWIRWYKLSGDSDSRQWVAKLRERDTPPLAIVGGDTSDRALALAKTLADAREGWSGPAPLLLITTATAERYFPKDSEGGITAHDTLPKLMSVYAGRSFRFSFTNSRMVEAVLDFIRQSPQVWPQKQADPALYTGVVASRDAWGSLGLLAAAGHLQPYYIYTLAWGDDGYSKDLAEIFATKFAEQSQLRNGKDLSVADADVPYSVGDQFQANPRERIAVDLLLRNRGGLREQQHLLVVPTGAQRSRRFLRTLCRRAPLEIRNLVVVNGDAISFNTIYRDRDIAWNILDLPVPLVFFSHRNPIDTDAGFHPQKSATGTQDLLLYRDIFEALLLATFNPDGMLVDADQVEGRLRTLRWHKQHVYLPSPDAGPPPGLPFFEAEGNRHAGSGEHVVWLQPLFDGTLNLPQAVISVWRPSRTDSWRMTGPPLEVFYNRSSAEGRLGD